MKKNNVRKHRKIFILIIVIMITAITLAVETYAWFVGLSTASTGDITIAISSADGLDLSLNGQYWTNGGTELKIKDADHTYITETGCTNANCAYNGNKNIWPEYLNPVSTIGEIDTSTSKLKLFEKTSLASNPGGYYITSSQVDNSATEGNGYVAFDLYIRNGTGSAYNETYNKDADEDIYLSPDSFASTVVNGNQPDYGAANSVRVGFFEIGRTKSDTGSIGTIRNMKCGKNKTGVTALCTGSANMTKDGTILYTNDELLSNTWNIWEPNHASHSTNLVNYYNTVCKKRTNSDYTRYNDLYRVPEFDYCDSITTGSIKKTYSMKSVISDSQSETNKVNIYDGFDNNHYDQPNLSEVKTYKTSDALSTDNEKVPLIKIAGNSITKVRVYIWLEGQDIDNYDVISQNPSVQVKFGLTKDRNAINESNNNAINNTQSSFANDSWSKIKENVQSGNTSHYHLGDMKTIRIKGEEYRLRIANMSSPTGICTSSSYSQTACGFVVEFVDELAKKPMMNTQTNVGGYPASIIYSYLNNEAYNNLPNDLKNSILNTRVISGHGTSESNNFISNNQKLYLLSTKEVSGYDNEDTAASATRQLDYYIGKSYPNRLSGGNFIFTVNAYKGNGYWWLRNPIESPGFAVVDEYGMMFDFYGVTSNENVIPAFRIG